MFKIDYIKRKNSKLFSNFGEIKNLQLTNVHNYSPLYTRFFSLNETNYNSINLNHKWYLNEIYENESESESESELEMGSETGSEMASDSKLNSSGTNSKCSSDLYSEDCLINIYNCSITAIM